jgi:hypothetical protein
LTYWLAEVCLSRSVEEDAAARRKQFFLSCLLVLDKSVEVGDQSIP